MCTRWIALLFAAGVVVAQNAPESNDVKKQKARELLEKVDTALGALNPEVSAMVLAQLGGAWKPIDEKRAVSSLQQAFAAAAALPDDGDRPVRSKMEGEIVKAAVQINLAEASQLLRGMAASDSRTEAANAVINALVEKKEYDQAMEVLALTPADADYPFAAAQNLFEELPKDDSRRLLVFGNAASAYRRRPGDAFRLFLGKHWQEVPRETAQASLAVVVRNVLDREDEPGSGESLETAKGTVKLAGRKSMELFDLLGAIRALDPVRFKLLEEQYADLRAAAKQFPEGRQSVENSGTMRTVAHKDSWNSSFNDSDSGLDVLPPLGLFSGDPDKLQEEMRSFMTAQKKAGEALAAFPKDHTRGLSLADDVSLPSLRAVLLLKFAENVKKDPAAARNLLSKGESILGDIADPGDRVQPAISAAELEHELKNDKAAWALMEQAMTGVVALYKSDTNAERPNKALREFWPSTLGCRFNMWNAAKFFGTRSEELIASLPGPDLPLMAQVDLARALLGVALFDSEHASASFQVMH